MDLRIAGRRAFVTGSTAGIGLEVATTLAAEGLEVTIHGRDPDRTAQVARGKGVSPAFGVITGDLVDGHQRAEVIEAVTAGRFDIVVNAAGPFSEHTVETATPQDWSDAFTANVISAVDVSRAALPWMREQGWGRVITIGTRAVRTPLPNMIEYSAAKAALEAASIAMAQHVADTGITVNMVSPGVILTPGLREMFAARTEYEGRPWEDIEPLVTTTYAPNPVGRLGRPHDIAAMVTFLASESAGYITGANIPVDGGITGTR